MPISLLTFGDAEFGRSLQDWGNEFVYAMGVNFNFDEANYGPSETIVLAIVCLPPEMAGIGNGTSLKRSSSEFWSTFEADYVAFSSRLPANKISAVATALVGAIQQIPEKWMPVEAKDNFTQATRVAAASLLALSCCRFRGHQDKVFSEPEGVNATTEVQPRVQA
ncbi:hypothetical protein [Sphingomonas panacis]|uniref:hypothetical protein n=1 Tax=Sphingomonas panacis TaxID=1560345 RepID=UPI0012375339|nr:hypothetical protein [Sphingomonas panacis]